MRLRSLLLSILITKSVICIAQHPRHQFSVGAGFTQRSNKVFDAILGTATFERKLSKTKFQASAIYASAGLEFQYNVLQPRYYETNYGFSSYSFFLPVGASYHSRFKILKGATKSVGFNIFSGLSTRCTMMASLKEKIGEFEAFYSYEQGANNSYHRVNGIEYNANPLAESNRFSLYQSNNIDVQVRRWSIGVLYRWPVTKELKFVPSVVRDGIFESKFFNKEASKLFATWFICARFSF